MSWLDHGLLNLPLSKRGNIDLEIDRYLAEKKALESARDKAHRKRWKELVGEAARLVAALTDERLVELGAPHKLTAKQTRAQLMSIASTRPETAIAALSKEIQP